MPHLADVLCVGLLLLFAGGTVAAEKRDPGTNICSQNPSVGRAVLSAVNLSWPGLAAVLEASEQGDLAGACSALADYYLHGNTSAWLRRQAPAGAAGHQQRVGTDIDLVVDHDIYSFTGLTTKVPRNADGGLAWDYEGPHHDDEFMNCLNRHGAWQQLLEAWMQTGNKIYSQYFNAAVSDWVLHLPCRAGVSRSHWNATGSNEPCPGQATASSPWRSLECGFRSMGGCSCGVCSSGWPAAFFGFMHSPDFSVSSRVLMLVSVCNSAQFRPFASRCVFLHCESLCNLASCLLKAVTEERVRTIMPFVARYERNEQLPRSQDT